MFGPGSPAELSEKKDALIKAATEATVSGLSGETFFDNHVHESTRSPMIAKRADKRREVQKALADLDLAKSLDAGTMAALNNALTGAKSEMLSKEWSLSNPISTGLVPFDLEAPAKLLTPRPTPLRNSIPRVKGSGAARRFKVISGFTGTGTGGIGTLQPGITESTTNAGPGGLNYVRPPYISYNGYDVVISYVSSGLSDSVSWQAEYEGAGFEDIRSLSNTALLYATMLMDERLMVYGRGTTGNGYAGALAAASIASVASVAASSAPSGSSTLTGTTYWVVAAADAGDLLGTTGSFHQGPSSAAASVTVAAGQAIQVNITADVAGALGYNLFVGSVSTGPFCYAGRTGYNVGFITAPPSLAVGTTTASSADGSAIATNYDGLFTNIAASGGYVKRLNSTFNTSNPGVELQAMFSSLFDSVKADPDEAWFNGHDRSQLSNALLASGSTNNYTVFLAAPDQAGARIGALVQGIYNQITGKEVGFMVHPWFPQGNAMVRSVSLPIPDSNVTQTSVMAMVQDYVAIQWPVQQFTYDASTLEIGTMAHYAPGWNGVIQGIQQNG
jgi:hypothetical protein